jgi:hypothetical protein
MPLNYPPFVVLGSHFRITGGHDLNPSPQTLLSEDRQLFTAFNQAAVQVMATAGLGPQLRPVVVALASMAPGVSPVQRVQLATLFVKNAMAALNNPAPALEDVVMAVAASRPGRVRRGRTEKALSAKKGRRSASRSKT